MRSADRVVLELIAGPAPLTLNLADLGRSVEVADGYWMLVRWTDDRTGEKRTSGPLCSSLRYMCRVWQLTALEVLVDSTKLPAAANG